MADAPLVRVPVARRAASRLHRLPSRSHSRAPRAAAPPNVPHSATQRCTCPASHACASCGAVEGAGDIPLAPGSRASSCIQSSTEFKRPPGFNFSVPEEVRVRACARGTPWPLRCSLDQAACCVAAALALLECRSARLGGKQGAGAASRGLAAALGRQGAKETLRHRTLEDSQGRSHGQRVASCAVHGWPVGGGPEPPGSGPLELHAWAQVGVNYILLADSAEGRWVTAETCNLTTADTYLYVMDGCGYNRTVRTRCVPPAGTAGPLVGSQLRGTGGTAPPARKGEGICLWRWPSCRVPARLTLRVLCTCCARAVPADGGGERRRVRRGPVAGQLLRRAPEDVRHLRLPVR